ncbi:TonB-dependent receptor [Alcaligenaceae bacterium]|nr:TonB-dependent receptor [Alcaligenaceae bacterium]
MSALDIYSCRPLRPATLWRVHAPTVAIASAFPLFFATALNPAWAESGSNAISQLDSIVVTASANERLLEDAPASVTVLTREDLRRRPVYDVADAVEGTPGISLSGVGINGKGISVRGMKTDHTLILYDGMRVNQSGPLIYGSDFEHGWMPAEAIERIEIVRGPMSSLYGSEALGGVVNVITRRPTDEWINAFSVDGVFPDNGRGADRHRLGAYVSGPLIDNVLGLTVSGEYQHRQALYAPKNDAASAYRETSMGYQKSMLGTVGLTWTPDARQRVDATISTGKEDRWRNSASYRSDDDIRRQRASLSHSGDWQWGKSEIRLYRTSLKRTNLRSDGAHTGPHEFTEEVANGMVSVQPWSGHTLTLGSELRKETLEDPVVNLAGKANATHKAFFLQDEIMLGENWEILIGSRFDNHPNYGWQVSPRAYVLYHATDALVFKAGAGKGFRAPTLKQLSPGYRATFGRGSEVFGNPDLKPETSVSYEAGFDYTADTWNASAMLFLNQVEDLVDTHCVAGCSGTARRYEYININKARIRGLELGLGAELPWNLELNANYTFLDATDRTSNIRLTDRSRHAANATLTWHPAPDWSASVRVQYVGSQRTTSASGHQPGYTLVSLYGSHEVSRHLTLRAGIENITNKRLADDSVDYTFADEGRRLFLGMEMRF